ncbi:MAG: aldehyde ferredoxin oxidoreductase family protein [Planctomycetota bacterium]|jgi:aldehyde:ferredoxin oxidoreductase
MPFGRHGAYLRVDLETGSATRVPVPDEIADRFVGGVGLGSWICLKEGGAEADPFAPDAPLVFTLSPLVGTPLTTSAKFAVVARSPLTGVLSDAISSSHFAIAAKRAGYDAYVLKGKAPGFSRLVIDDGAVFLEDASTLRGLAPAACELEGFRTAAIGLAGENLVRYASISNDRRHAGRGGLGAVMGAKNLKAFSIRGSRRVEVADPRGVVEAAGRISTRSFGPVTAKYRELGTIANVLAFNRLNALPTRNFQDGTFEDAPRISAEALHEFHGVGRESCAACTIGCEHLFRTSRGESVRLEYESLFAFGSLLGIGDRNAVLAAVARCDELGLDTISTGGTLAFGMEAGVAGLQFGDPDGVLTMLGGIAAREGAGDLLAEGSRRASQSMGCPELAMHVKGMEIPGYDPRTLQAMALGFAVGSRGADHNRSGAYELDFSTEVDRLHLTPADAAKVVEVENRTAAMDSLILCKFLRGIFEDFASEAGELLHLVTGADLDLREVGARVCTLRKIFNIRAGWRPEDDTLPARLLAGPLTPESLADMIRQYYRARDWPAEGLVPPDTAEKMSLGGLSCP